MRLENWIKLALTAAITLVANFTAQGQCENWIGKSFEEQASEEHVLYRQFLKSENYTEAFKHWQKAYELAPAADGQRPFHYSDGRALYMEKYKAATDEAQKKEFADNILRLYDEQIKCYGDDAFLLGRKAFDMFYHLRTPYPTLLATLKEAVAKGGNKTEYIVLDPYAHVIVHLFQNDQMPVEEARETILRLNEIADYNVENNNDYGPYYQQAKDAMNGTLQAVEYDIFDCAYYKEKFEPEFKANPDDYEKIKLMYNRLVAQGCAEDDPLVAQLKSRYDEVVSAINAEKLAEFYIENPGAHAKALYDEGKYSEAISKYKEAIDKEEGKGDGADNETLATYNFAIASILFRKMDQYSSAREYARKAAKLKPNWGQPYMAIGDMYAASSNSCGKDSWDKQIAVLAALDKYAYAKSIDDSVADEANSKIAKYSGFRPERQEGFMRGIKEGQTVKVGCWIGESVVVRFQ